MSRLCKKCGGVVEGKRCPPCTKAYHQEYGKRYYEQNKVSVNARIAANREAKKEQYRAMAAAHYQKNKAQILAKHAEWRRNNPEKVKQGNHAWRAANKDRVAQVNAAWVQNNKDRCNTYVHNRRARIKANGGKLSPNIRQVLFTRQSGLCACCGEPLGASYELDHIMPLSLGGKNTDDNVQLLRRVCNRSKRNSHPEVFARRQQGGTDGTIC